MEESSLQSFIAYIDIFRKSINSEATASKQAVDTKDQPLTFLYIKKEAGT